jgi:hypothetical protein
MEEVRRYRYIIKRREDDDRRWKVVPSPDNPRQHPVGGAILTWEFEKGAYDRGLEAHFQFCHSVVEPSPKDPEPREVCFIASEQINKDWAASIPDHHGNTFLTGTLRKVPPKKKMHYAVWIVDPKGINDFAVGDNPPPDIQTGGG